MDTPDAGESATEAMTATKFSWRPLLCALVLAVTLALIIKSDHSAVAWASQLSAQGSEPPPRDSNSPTGYALGQRQFLGTHERGDTYRWIAATQEFIAAGPFSSKTYLADNVPLGRPRLDPKLYAAWVAVVAWGTHAISGEPMPISVEHAALWEPVVSHALAYVVVVAVVWVGYGGVSAVFAGLFFALLPAIAGQFLAGVLTPRTWALLFAAYALACHLRRPATGSAAAGFGVASAIATSLALWLDPAAGFSVVVISCGVAIVAIMTRRPPILFLRWSLVGAVLTTAAWLVDQAPWDISAGELRSVHPLYALAWIGIGLGLDAWQALRTSQSRRPLRVAEVVVALLLLSALPYTQLKHGYKGWLYSSAAMERLTSVDETRVFTSAADWLAHATTAESLCVLVPLLGAVAALAARFLRKPRDAGPEVVIGSIVYGAVLVLAGFDVRWIVVATLLSLAVLIQFAWRESAAGRRIFAGVAVAFLVLLLFLGRATAGSLLGANRPGEPTAADLTALIGRHFSHWLASHNAGQNISALAPPELSDSLVFHGGCRVLMSTAWQSYPGQVAASRILSAPESTEAEAVLQSREITHVILPSWDKVLPLLVRNPSEEGRTTLYARLQRWVFPAYLRPIPYHLPPIPGFANQKLVICKVVAPQDEALALSRLAEYFVEMNRDEPATLAAKVLAESYADDPNAAIARAIVAAHVNDRAALEREAARLASDVSAGRIPSSWDRRVQRAIVFALARRPELERTEILACVANASREGLFELTPLQAYRLCTLARHAEATFPNSTLGELAEALGADYSPRPSPSAGR